MSGNLITLCEHVVNLGYLVIVIYPSQVCRPNHKPTSTFSVKNVQIDVHIDVYGRWKLNRHISTVPFHCYIWLKCLLSSGNVIDFSLSHVKKQCIVP